MIWLLAYFIIVVLTTAGFRLLVKKPNKNNPEYMVYEVYTVLYGLLWFISIPVALIHFSSDWIARRVKVRDVDE